MQASLAPPRKPSRPLEDLVRRASDAPIPGPDEAERLASAAADGDSRALETLVRTHLRLVVDEAIRYRGAGDRMRDLVPDGLDALVDAARSYRPLTHGGFRGFARTRIRQAITRRYAPN